MFCEAHCALSMGNLSIYGTERKHFLSALSSLRCKSRNQNAVLMYSFVLVFSLDLAGMRLPKEDIFLILVHLQMVFGLFKNSHRIPDHSQGEFKFLVKFR